MDNRENCATKGFRTLILHQYYLQCAIQPRQMWAGIIACTQEMDIEDIDPSMRL
jgi:hypothetical protein